MRCTHYPYCPHFTAPAHTRLTFIRTAYRIVGFSGTICPHTTRYRPLGSAFACPSIFTPCWTSCSLGTEPPDTHSQLRLRKNPTFCHWCPSGPGQFVPAFMCTATWHTGRFFGYALAQEHAFIWRRTTHTFNAVRTGACYRAWHATPTATTTITTTTTRGHRATAGRAQCTTPPRPPPTVAALVSSRVPAFRCRNIPPAGDSSARTGLPCLATYLNADTAIFAFHTLPVMCRLFLTFMRHRVVGSPFGRRLAFIPFVALV